MDDLLFECVLSVADDLNVLIVGAGDTRHLLKTMAHAYRHRRRKINVGIKQFGFLFYHADLVMTYTIGNVAKSCKWIIIYLHCKVVGSAVAEASVCAPYGYFGQWMDDYGNI